MTGVFSGLVGSFASVAAGPTNLMPNPGFETSDLTGWVSQTDAPLTRDTSNPHSGTYYLRSFSANSEFGQATFTKTGLLTVGQGYSFSVWVRDLGGQVTLNFGTTVVIAGVSVVADTWTSYKVENVLCAGNTTFSFDFNATSTLAIDDIKLVNAATVTP